MKFTDGLQLIELVVLGPPFTINPSHDGKRFPLEPGQEVKDDWATIPGLSCEVELTTPGVIEITGHVGFQFSVPKREEAKYLLAVRVTIDGKLVYGSQESENELDTQHYEDRDISVVAPVSAGVHLVEVQARAHLKSGPADAQMAVKEGHYTRVQVKVFGSPA